MTQHSVKVQEYDGDEVSPLRKRVRQFVGFEAESMDALTRIANEWLVAHPGSAITSVHHTVGTGYGGSAGDRWTIFTILLEVTR